MGFSLGSFLGGAADAASESMDNAKVDREKERKKVEDMIFSTSARLFENASSVQKSRSAKKKVDDEFMNTLISSAPSMQNDPAKQAFVLSLDETARNDLLTMVIDPSFNAERRPLVDYLDAIDDPIEFKDPVTLNQRVQGKVVDRPLDKSSYYGVSNTEDKEVDKIVSSYTNSFSVAYDMSAAKAQGLLASATNEVKVQSFTIDWVVKRRDRAQVVAQTAAQVATAQLGTANGKMAVTASMTTSANKQIEATRLNYIRNSGQSEELFDIQPENQAKFLASAEYKAATKAIITSAVQRMEENPVIKESTERFLADSFPGKWGGRVGGKDIETVDKLKDNVYYEGTFTNGTGIALGSVIKAAAADAGAGSQGNTGSTGQVNVKDQTIVSEKGSTYNNGDVTKPNKVDEGVTTPKDTKEIVRMNNELKTATGSYKKYLERQLGDDVGFTIKTTPSEQADQAVKDLKRQGIELKETGFDTWEELKESLLDNTVEEKIGGFGRRIKYVPESLNLRTNETSMEIAIEEGDADKVQQILDNLQRMSNAGPSFDMMKKIGGVRGDGLRALKSLSQDK
jgi:hypothetical protein